MAIQNRHGTYPYFDQGKMVTGEFAIVTGGDPHTSTGKAVYICFAPGDCQRFATNEEISAAISDAIEQSGEFQDVVETTVTEVLEDHPEWTTTIQDGAVTTAKIADGAVTPAKLSSDIPAYIGDLTFSSLNTSSKTLPGAVNELNNKLVDFDITFKIGTITIPDGTSSPTTTQIDITDIKPSGYSSYGAILCLREYQLPYIQSNGSAGTWVTHLNNTRVSITNRAGAWSNYDYYLTVIWKKN